jgi:hypothetical protein
MQGHWNWDVATTPCSTSGGAQPACFALKEVGDNDFKLLRSFGYRSREWQAHDPGDAAPAAWDGPGIPSRASSGGSRGDMAAKHRLRSCTTSS